MKVLKVVAGHGVQIVEDDFRAIGDFLCRAARLERMGHKAYREGIDVNNRTEVNLRGAYSMEEKGRLVRIVKDLRDEKVVAVSEDDLWVAKLLIATDRWPWATTESLLDRVEAPWDVYPTPVVSETSESYW